MIARTPPHPSPLPHGEGTRIEHQRNRVDREAGPRKRDEPLEPSLGESKVAGVAGVVDLVHLAAAKGYKQRAKR